MGKVKAWAMELEEKMAEANAKYPTNAQVHQRLLDAGLCDYHVSDCDEGYLTITFHTKVEWEEED